MRAIEVETFEYFHVAIVLTVLFFFPDQASDGISAENVSEPADEGGGRETNEALKRR